MPLDQELTTILEHALGERPRGLMTDIDGTISEIAPTPSEATVVPEARAALDQLASSLDLVAAISGRAAEDAYGLIGLDELVYSGNHGMEWWRHGRVEQSNAAKEHTPKIGRFLEDLARHIDLDGVFIENKGLTASIHVRGTERPEYAEALVSQHAERLAGQYGLRVTLGRMVIEARPPIDLNKGTSVLDLVARFSLRGAVYLGDDVTDVDAFRAFRRDREQSGRALYAIGVVGPETPETVVEHADALVSGTRGVVELLEAAIRISRAA